VTNFDEYLRPLFDIVADNSIVVITEDHGEKHPETKWETRFYSRGLVSRKYLHSGWLLRPVDERLAAVAVGHG
jgi:arylsulfatase A-like enzyme